MVERERERERESVCVSEKEKETEKESVCEEVQHTRAVKSTSEQPTETAVTLD